MLAEDFGLDNGVIPALLMSCRMSEDQTVCMAALVSAIMFPFDVDAIKYACKNYRRSMYRLIMYAARAHALVPPHA